MLSSEIRKISNSFRVHTRAPPSLHAHTRTHAIVSFLSLRLSVLPAGNVAATTTLLFQLISIHSSIAISTSACLKLNHFILPCISSQSLALSCPASHLKPSFHPALHLCSTLGFNLACISSQLFASSCPTPLLTPCFLPCTTTCLHLALRHYLPIAFILPCICTPTPTQPCRNSCCHRFAENPKNPFDSAETRAQLKDGSGCSAATHADRYLR